MCSDIDFAAPPPFKQIADLRAVDRDVENRGHDFELFDTVVFVAGVHGHLPHDELLGVVPVLLSRHSAWFVGALPNEGFIAMGSTGGGPTAHALVLSASHDVDIALAQFADDEVIVE